jgi:hypothetical protein
LGFESIRDFSLNKNKRRFARLIVQSKYDYNGMQKHGFEFKYVLPNSTIVGRYVKFLLTYYFDGVYFVEKNSRSYADGYKSGLSSHHKIDPLHRWTEKDLNNAIDLIEQRDLSSIKDNMFDNTKYILTYTKDYKNFSKEYTTTSYDDNENKIISREYKNKIQDGTVTTYFEKSGIPHSLIRSTKHSYGSLLNGKTRIYDYVIDNNGEVKQYLVYEGDLTIIDYYKTLDGEETKWSLKKIDDQIIYNKLFEHKYSRETEVGSIKMYKNNEYEKNIVYYGSCKKLTSYDILLMMYDP